MSILRAWAEINLDNLVHNLNKIREFADNREVMGVIKANAYGMGAVEYGRILSKNGVKNFGVACYEEASELYQAGIKGEILIFGCTPLENIASAIFYGFNLAISSFEEIDFLEENGLYPKVHIKVDTGMGRVGFTPEEAMRAISYIRERNIAEILGVYSHLSVADESEEDEYTLSQLHKFIPFEDLDFIKYRHVLNSCGTLRFGDKAPKSNMVRAGIILQGIVPFESELRKEFKHVFSFKSKILFLKEIQEKSFISYGNSEVVFPGDLIATIGVGYGDGFNRKFSNGGTVEINGVKCTVVGRVCMDMTMVKIPKEIRDEVFVGTEVTLIGEDIIQKAECLGTIPYEIMTGLGRRVTKFYIKNGEVVKVKSLQEIDKVTL